MNRRPDQSGITKYWRVGEDDRCDLRQRTALSDSVVDRMLKGLWETIRSRRRTKFVGFGVFEWRPYRRRLPTGRMVETWRLAFKPSRYAEKYKGGQDGDR